MDRPSEKKRVARTTGKKTAGAAGAIAISRWIESYLQDDPPRAKSLTATVIGDAIAPHGGEIWLGQLIELLAPFGFNDRLVRTSVFRLAEEGILESRRQGRLALYTMTTGGRRRFERAHRRIYMPPSQNWDGIWTLVLTPRSSGGDVDRAELRRELAWLGFAVIAPGILAHPAADAAALREVLDGLNLLDKVHVMQASDFNYFGARPASELVQQHWTLDELVATYDKFITRFAPALDMVKRQRDLDTRQAFQLRTLAIHDYRRAILHDPQFPAEILPTGWHGHTAYQICRDLYNLCCRSAERYLAVVLGIPEDRPQPALPYYYLRFGGLVS